MFALAADWLGVGLCAANLGARPGSSKAHD
jgi:hypothetical protein